MAVTPLTQMTIITEHSPAALHFNNPECPIYVGQAGQKVQYMPPQGGQCCDACPESVDTNLHDDVSPREAVEHISLHSGREGQVP